MPSLQLARLQDQSSRMPRRYGVFLLNSFVVYRFQLDVTDENAVTNAAKYIEEKDGKLDILVNKYGLYLN